jgi:purine-binding chemotaxis protein CheW
MRLKMSKQESVKNESNELLQLVSFELNGEEFGIDILMVQEIIRMLQITKVPNSPEFVDGVINIRGRIIPVVDLRCKLNMARKEHDNDTRIVVVEVEGRTTGFIVDKVTEVLRIPANITEAPPDIVAGVNSEFIKSVGKLDGRLLILIDLEKILTCSDIAKLNQVA